ncbi:MAG: LacI family DNA-binding transcriptional regulator [Bacteroidales bacterium]
MKHHLTLKDIALQLNLSVSTISRALRDDATIAPETREKIKAYAASHHYKPNNLAASLRKKESNIIGVIIPEISNLFFSTIIAGMEAEAEKNNFALIIVQSNEDYQTEVKAVHTLLNTRVAGILVSLAKTTEHYEHFDEVINSHVPLVFFDRICTGVLTDKVVCSDYKGAFGAVEYMIHTGCKRIAYFGSESKLEIAKNRKMGYLDALRKNRIEVDPQIIFDCDTDTKAKELTPDVLQMKNRPDAIFAINDSTAAGILFMTKKAGVKIPDELSICGFGDGYISQHTDPTITSIDQFPYEIGKQSMELIIRKIKHPELYDQVTNKVVNTALIIRESTKNIEF